MPLAGEIMNQPQQLPRRLAGTLESNLHLAPAFVQLHQEDAAVLREEIAAGLLQTQALIAPKYFYNALGSRLFEAITDLPEYYPTRTEAQILHDALPQITQALGQGATLIDLGAGNCAKAARLFDALAPAQYVAVDISVEFLREALDRLQRQHPRIAMLGVGMDFSARLALPPHVRGKRRVFFYPGSSIGNFEPQAAEQLLRQMAQAAGPGGQLLIGMDLIKPEEILVPAYDDALGVTAAFNLNVLQHVNSLLGSNFDVRQWQHVALYNRDLARIEMHLQARSDVQVRWPGGQRSFVAGQCIHTESSHKYSVDTASALLQRSGFTVQQVFTGAQQHFAVLLAQVA
jgi:L-histidine Nalpha-methyltransferase